MRVLAKHGLTLKWIKGQTRPYGFKGYKDQKCGLRAHFYEQNRFLEKRRRKRGENLGFARRSGFG